MGEKEHMQGQKGKTAKRGDGQAGMEGKGKRRNVG